MEKMDQEKEIRNMYEEKKEEEIKSADDIQVYLTTTKYLKASRGDSCE